MITLRIHHFYDIIRDFGRNTGFRPHPYGHSYHKIAEAVWNNPNLYIKIISEADDTCTGCMHLKGKSCNDFIYHREDFRSKEKFNDHIDGKIMKVCSINENDVFSVTELCRKARLYLDNIIWIYEGNDPDHTESRKLSVINGLEKFLQKNKPDNH